MRGEEEDSFPRMSQAQLGMFVGIGSLSMLFAASLVGYFITRAQAKAWRAIDLPQLPLTLWLSTALLIGLSMALHWSLRAIRENRSLTASRRLFTAFLLGLLFCAAQAENWRQVASVALNQEVKGLYIYTFFMLTALHVVHVLAGLFPLWWVHKKAQDGQYSSSTHEGLVLVRQYWDFLLVVWGVLLIALHLA